MLCGDPGIEQKYANQTLSQRKRKNLTKRKQKKIIDKSTKSELIQLYNKDVGGYDKYS